MLRKFVFETIYLVFSIVSLTVLAPAVLPGIAFHGGLVTAIVLGSLFHGFQRLWKRGSDRLMGIAPGSCPMPAVMRWVVVSVVASIIVFVGACGLLAPTVYEVGGVFSAIFGGLVVLVGMMLANFVTRPLSAIWKEASDQPTTAGDAARKG